ncbi:MAG: ATP-binding cassette domain-containing protein, partial [Microbacteriaceae bacterium]
VIFVGQQLLTGELATGLATLGIFLAGAVRIMGSILPLQTAVAALKINVERAQLAQGLLAEVRDDARLAATLPSSQTAVVDVTMPLAVSIVDADYTYSGDEHTTLTGIELTIEAGSYSAIIGPSGAGKTTIVDVILGLIRPQEGKVEIGGVEPNALRAIAPGLVSYVPQKPGLVSGTIAENIALGVDPSAIDHDLLAEVVHSAYLSEFIASLPDGLNTSVGKQADALSGGQIQRIGLARALYVRPKLLILDEATSGLDAGSEAVVGDSLRALHGAVTVIVIAHRLSTVQHADVVHVVEGGRIVASGDFPTVKRTVPMVAEYVKLMSFEADTPPTGGSVAQTTTAEVKDDGLA